MSHFIHFPFPGKCAENPWAVFRRVSVYPALLLPGKIQFQYYIHFMIFYDQDDQVCEMIEGLVPDSVHPLCDSVVAHVMITAVYGMITKITTALQVIHNHQHYKQNCDDH